MSIIVSNIRMPYGISDEEVISKTARSLGFKKADLVYSGIYRESIDLRHGTISKLYSVEFDHCSCAVEQKLADGNPNIYFKPNAAFPTATGSNKITAPPVVVGFGPAGMFAALILAENGFRPIVIERGSRMDERDKTIQNFFGGGKLDPCSNIQFGEGGAGAYSDGKLTTRINDPLCLIVLDELKKHGAPEKILRLAKPHIGTDLLKNIVVSIRSRIDALGGKVCFDTPMTGLRYSNGRLNGVVTPNGTIDTDIAVLAVGHSARDTIAMLYQNDFVIEPKAFSVGLRVEHSQSELNYSVFGKHMHLPDLPQAEYNLSAKPFDRGCYSFCMCPGGFVIAAASEEEGVVTNGMSYHSRSGNNANSAICVSVLPSDFSSDSPLAGIEFQRELEHRAYIEGGRNYSAPVQTVGDFMNGKRGNLPKNIHPTYPIGVKPTDFGAWLPGFVTDTIRASMPQFARKLACFGSKDAVFTGVETRTSSPVRITRGIDMHSLKLQGVIPCGEGAGYAGGIMSAAVDGIRAASAILRMYKI